MKALDLFAPEIAGELPEASDPAIEAAVLDAATRFCTEAYVWTEAGFAQDLRAGVAEYFINPPRDGQVQAVLGVYVDGQPITVFPMDGYPYGTTASGTPYSAFVTDNNRLMLYPTPDADRTGALVVRVAAIPRPGAKSLPDVLFDRYRNGIRHGALMALKGKSGESWYDPNAVAMHSAEFRKEISRARADMIRGRSNRRVMARRRRFC